MQCKQSKISLNFLLIISILSIMSCCNFGIWTGTLINFHHRGSVTDCDPLPRESRRLRSITAGVPQIGIHYRGSPAKCIICLSFPRQTRRFLTIRFHFRGNHRGYRGFLAPRIFQNRNSKLVIKYKLKAGLNNIYIYNYIYIYIYIFIVQRFCTVI